MSLPDRFQSIMHIWNRLVEPDVSVQDAEQRQNARLLAGMLLIIAAVITFILPPSFLADTQSPYSIPRLIGVGAGLVILLLAYQITRRGHYRAAAKLTVWTGSLVIFVSAGVVAPTIGTGILYYNVVTTLFASLFLSVRFTALVAVGHILGMIVFPTFAPAFQLHEILEGPISFNLMLTLLALVFARYRSVLETQRASRLIQSETRYRMISELISDYAFSFRVEPDGTIHREWMTNGFVDITGYTPEELDVIGPFSMYHPDDVHLVQEDMERAMQGEAKMGEYRVIRKDGRVRWLTMYRRPVWDSTSSRVVRYYGLAQDITERKEDEAVRLKMALQQERLSLAGNFVKAVSHDFRTSLATIETSRYLIAQTIPPQDKTEKRLDNIRYAVGHLTEQLENLQTLSSLISPNMHSFNINPHIEQLVEALKPNAKNKGVTLTFTPDTQLPPISADAQELTRAIKHLLVNAVTYSPQGGEVMIRTHQTGDMISVQIQDSGVGIDQQDLPHIFNFFYRADDARPTNLGGVGLGLSIVKMIIEAHNGSIHVDSEPGVGSTFTLTLPILLDEAPVLAGVDG